MAGRGGHGMAGGRDWGRHEAGVSWALGQISRRMWRRRSLRPDLAPLGEESCAQRDSVLLPSPEVWLVRMSLAHAVVPGPSGLAWRRDCGQEQTCLALLWGVRKSDIAFHLITKSLFFSLDGLSVSERGCGLGSRLTWTFRSVFLPPGPLACPGSCVFSPSSSRTHPHPHLCRLLVLSEWRSGAEQGHRFGGQTWAHVELSILLETARRGAECSFPNPCDREVEGWMAQEAWANS